MRIRSLLLIIFSCLFVLQSYAGKSLEDIDSQNLSTGGRNEIGSVSIDELQYKYTNVDSNPGTLNKFLEGEIGLAAAIVSGRCSAETDNADRIFFSLERENQSNLMSIKVYERLGIPVLRPEGCVNMPFPIWLHIPFKIFKEIGLSYNISFGKSKMLKITYVGNDKITVTIN